MPIFGKSKIGDSCFIDSDALIGYPHNKELDLLENNPAVSVLRELTDFQLIRIN